LINIEVFGALAYILSYACPIRAVKTGGFDVDGIHDRLRRKWTVCQSWARIARIEMRFSWRSQYKSIMSKFQISKMAITPATASAKAFVASW